MASPNNVFSLASIEKSRYGYERQWFTYAASASAPLATGQNTVFNVSNWNTDGVEKIITIDRLAATQNAGIQLQWLNDGTGSDHSQGWTDAMPAGMRPWKPNIVAKNNTQLIINNMTGSTVSSFNLNYAVTVRQVSVADDELLDFEVSDADLEIISRLDTLAQKKGFANALAEVKESVKVGHFPINFWRTLEFIIKNRILPDNKTMLPFHLTVPAGSAGSATSPSRSFNVGNGEVHMITGIALEGASNVTLYCDRDGDMQHIALSGPNFLNADDLPWDVTMFYTNYLTYYMTTNATLSSATTFPGRIEVARYKLSDVLKAHLLITKRGSTFEKVRAGWL